ncbi:MAG: NBR1-Ig-like domain-containing protein [Anaerolineales bacterium]
MKQLGLKVDHTPAILLTVITVILLTGCNYSAATPTPDQAATGSAATLDAQMTEVIAAFTATAEASSLTPTATATALPTETPTPTPYYTPTATLRPVLQDWARFVTDVTVPDGTLFERDETFTKTWRLMNIGLSTWTSDFSLVFVSGDRMSGRREIPLKGAIQPGYMVDLSVELAAPDADGEYRGYWALMNPKGEIFGIGEGGRDAFWVDIEVDSPDEVVYDFVDSYCDAEWSTGAGVLTCPGEVEDPEGWVIRLEEPAIEGRVEDEPGLWMQPEPVDQGYIQGVYPEYKVRRGDHFKALIACSADSPDCNVRFRLQYRIGSGDPVTLGQWNERSDGKFSLVDVDLNELEGDRVHFILSVLAKNEFEMDLAIWVAPSIWR